MLELHNNSISREAKPGIPIPGLVTFHGKSVVFLVIGVALFIFIFLALYLLGLDWYFALPVSLMPLVSLMAFVAFFINNRPPSYLTDLLYMCIWRIKTWLYLHGVKDSASPLWIESRVTIHPKEF
jgi:hypothetical protein